MVRIPSVEVDLSVTYIYIYILQNLDLQLLSAPEQKFYLLINIKQFEVLTGFVPI